MGDKDGDEEVPVEAVFAGRDSGHRDRVLLLVVRILAIYSFLVTAVAVAEALAITKLVPLQKPVPLLVTISPKTEAVVEVVPLSRKAADFEIAERAWVAEYVRVSEGIVADRETMRARLAPTSGWVARRSTSEVWNAMRARSQRVVVEALNRGVTRTVTIEGASPLQPHLWTVDFVLRDFDDGSEMRAVPLRVLVRVAYAGQTRPADALAAGGIPTSEIERAFGFTVVQYELSGR